MNSMKNSDILRAVRALPEFKNHQKWFELKGHATVNGCRVYSPELATFLTTSSIPVDPPGEGINGFEFVDQFVHGYDEGKRIFDEWRRERMAMHMDDLLVELEKFYQGWKYVCDSVKGFLFIPILNNAFEIGRDSALFWMASELLALHSVDPKTGRGAKPEHPTAGEMALFLYYLSSARVETVSKSNISALLRKYRYIRSSGYVYNLWTYIGKGKKDDPMTLKNLRYIIENTLKAFPSALIMAKNDFYEKEKELR